ncbi:MAG TPA: hypothetical protein VGN72_09060 [Tepidisphaeraceae bacterium]|jgi:hypothetical protein|nr:hypothetical protein [Tepidisphaeraceae bacterium]
MALYSRLLWLFVLVCHALAAGAWLAMMPGGFAMAHVRFWTNRAMPAVVLMVILIAMVAGFRKRLGVACSVLVGLMAMYLAAAVCCVGLYPISGRYPALACIVAAGVVALALAQLRRHGPGRVGTAMAVATGVAVGVVMTTALRAPLASTRASTAAAAAEVSATTLLALPTTTQPSRAVVRLTNHVAVHPGEGSLDVTAGRGIISVHPLLTFTSRSPDRFWTCFALRALRVGPPRHLMIRDASHSRAALHYADDGTSSLQVDAATDGAAVHIMATSTLPTAIYSHLNTFTEIHIAGHRRLSVAFSPCPQERIAFTSQDDAPARFAYIDADRRFHIVQARASEKGPFRTLATGRLNPDAPLTMSLFDEDGDLPLARITLHDWAAQASTALSPAGGWGVPQNAIEFSLGGRGERSVASMYITLAATSVGRGFESAGHVAGTYVNRITLETPAPTAAAAR